MITYHNLLHPNEKVNFKEAFMQGVGKGEGLFFLNPKEIPQISLEDLVQMKGRGYSDIASRTIFPYVEGTIDRKIFDGIIHSIYGGKGISPRIEHVTGNSHLQWLEGTTLAFKDFAAQFYGATLDHFCREDDVFKAVITATTGDTAPAIGAALASCKRAAHFMFYIAGEPSKQQERQMTTLRGNNYALEFRHGDFNVIQDIALQILKDKKFSQELFGTPNGVSSANSVNLGRLTPQIPFPFYAYSHLSTGNRPFVVSIPSGNFGDMTGTVLAKFMGLPIDKIVVGVNGNKIFPDFLSTGKYTVRDVVKSISMSMNVKNPKNFPRLISLYGGHIEGTVLTRLPDLDRMRNDIVAYSVSDEQTRQTMEDFLHTYGKMLEMHGAAGWRALENYLRDNFGGKHAPWSFSYETANPGKFPDQITSILGRLPEIPEILKTQATLPERKYAISSEPIRNPDKTLDASESMVNEVKGIMRQIIRADYPSLAKH